MYQDFTTLVFSHNSEVEYSEFNFSVERVFKLPQPLEIVIKMKTRMTK